VDGGTTNCGTLVRADNLDRLTAAGRAALHAYGVRTVIDLRNDGEREARPEKPSRNLATVHVPLDDVDDREFWELCRAEELDGSPLYYRLFLDRKPERCAAAVAAVARAGPGGVAFHCGVGRDRTGIVSLLLLALAGVEPEEIVADYELSAVRLRPLWVEWGRPDQALEIEEILRRRQTTARALLVELLGSLDPAAYLRGAGLSEDDLAAVRGRLLGDAQGPDTVAPHGG
jgi:hypothetical protein